MIQQELWISRDGHGMYYVWAVCPIWNTEDRAFDSEDDQALLGEIDWLRPRLKVGECKQYTVSVQEKKG